MNFAVWLDGTVLKVDLTDQLYAIYKGGEGELPVVKEAFEDSLEFLSKVSGKHEVVILSPYNEEVTGEIMRSIGLSFKYISHHGRTKPSKDPIRTAVLSVQMGSFGDHNDRVVPSRLTIRQVLRLKNKGRVRREVQGLLQVQPFPTS
jgi:hypothetical protein